ncbi:bile acid:sodium symporter [Methylocystis sp. IM3]|uniref:bile acid:sodium symporter family protein n=1 Tax=unclassified Methylocystis TaxID=2625913 RepID=UPI0030FC2850
MYFEMHSAIAIETRSGLLNLNLRTATGVLLAKRMTSIQHAIHSYFIWLILLSYVAAAFFPGLGLSIRSAEFGSIALGPSRIALSLPPAMLAFLLLNAGLGARSKDLGTVARYPRLLAAGVAGNLFAPLAFITAVSITMKFWHNSEEVQQILTGLALIAAMPIAGASTAWAQNANGNLALSLGLVLLTTLLSPVLTPIVLHSVAFLAAGDYSEDLHELASNGAGAFLGAWVILPSLLGIAGHRLLGETAAASISPYLKLTNSIVLILLNYSNAALSLPKLISEPDLDFLGAILAIVCLLCAAMFAAGYLIAQSFRADRAGAASLMFGLGMNNNGAGLVLASLALSDHPAVMIPVIIYNLVQHFFASLVDKLLTFKFHD